MVRRWSDEPEDGSMLLGFVPGFWNDKVYLEPGHLFSVGPGATRLAPAALVLRCLQGFNSVLRSWVPHVAARL